MNESIEYQGHPSHAHWNVALWVGNDEGLYHMAIIQTRDDFVQTFAWINKTPDGVTVTPQLAGYVWDSVHEDNEPGNDDELCTICGQVAEDSVHVLGEIDFEHDYTD